jgi:dual-action HEIGH metallo-peptidase
MRRLVKPLSAIVIVAFLSLLVYSCKKDAKQEQQQQEISAQVLDRIAALGFSKSNVQLHEDGYLVEGDIVLTEKDLNITPEMTFLRIAETEQYRTNNLVGSLPRTISVRVSTNLPSSYVTAANEAIRRYNAENLRARFTRVTSGGEIVFRTAPSGAGYLASAGFPSGGNPYSTIRVNSAFLGSNPGTNYLATIMAHEMGHCVGFRHTDWMNRAYSCGGSPVNEGASSVGAILIPGTPSGPDAGSWMLACIGSGQNRPFNTNDRTALNFVY